MNYDQVILRSKLFTKKDPEMDIRLKRMASRTWDAIGGDCLVNDMGEPDSSISLPRSHVIDIVGDADYMFTYGEDAEAYAYYIYLRDAFPTHRKKLMKEAFPYSRYGW